MATLQTVPGLKNYSIDREFVCLIFTIFFSQKKTIHKRSFERFVFEWFWVSFILHKFLFGIVSVKQMLKKLENILTKNEKRIKPKQLKILHLSCMKRNRKNGQNMMKGQGDKRRGEKGKLRRVQDSVDAGPAGLADLIRKLLKYMLKTSTGEQIKREIGEGW